jgi:hypothetical protein
VFFLGAGGAVGLGWVVVSRLVWLGGFSLLRGWLLSRSGGRLSIDQFVRLAHAGVGVRQSARLDRQATGRKSPGYRPGRDRKQALSGLFFSVEKAQKTLI